MATNPWDNDPIVQPAPGFTGVIPGAPKTPNVPSGFEDDATTTFYAQQILAGAPMPAMGMGKVASQNRQKVMAKVAEIAGGRGLSGEDLARQIAHYKAGSKQLSTLETQLGTTRQNEGTALANGQQFLDRSSELPLQSQFPALNSITQFFQKHTPIEGHDTKVAMDAAWNTFTTEYAKVVAGSPSGAGTLSDSARHEAQAVLQGNYSLTQKKAVFDQMKVDMANRLTAMHQSINEGYDTLTKQPGYEAPEDLSSLPVKPGKQQEHIVIPGVNDSGGPPPGIGDSGGGGSGDTPPGISALNDSQKQAYGAFLAANPRPTGDQVGAFLTKLTGKQVMNGEEIAKGIAQGRGSSSTVENLTEEQKVKQRLAEEDKLGLGDNPAEVLARHGATLNLSDEAAGVGNAAANLITDPLHFDPVGSYELGRDTERQRITNARETLGWGAPVLEFAGGMAAAAPTSALAAVDSIPQLIRQGAKGGAAGGAVAGFGAGQGLSQSLSGAAVGGAGGAAVGALAPYAAGKLAARGQPRGMAPDVAEAAKAEGVDLIRPMVDPSSRSDFGALESNRYSQPTIRAGADRTREQIGGRVEALGKDGTPLDTAGAGEVVQTAARNFIQRTKGVADRLYNIARARAGDETRFVPEKAIASVDQSIAELSANPKTNAGEISFLQGVKADLSTPGGKTIEELRQLRRSLRGRVNEQSLGATQAEGRAIAAMDATHLDAGTNLPKGAADAYRRADTFYRERQVHIDDILDRFLGGNVQQGQARLSGEQAFQRLKNMMQPGGDSRRLSALMRDMEPGERQDIAATIASTLGKDAPDGPFSAQRFLTQSAKLTPRARQIVFGADGAQSIENIRLLSRKMVEAGQDINRSRSATVLERTGWRQAARAFIASISGLGGYAAGGLEGGVAAAGVAAGTMAASAARKVLSARAMVNPRVSMWLAQAADVSTPAQAKQAVKGLSLIISREPALAQELSPIRDYLDQQVTQRLAAEPDDQDKQQN